MTIEHEVGPGDRTLEGIVRTLTGDINPVAVLNWMDRIAEINPGVESRRLLIGERLKLPDDFPLMPPGSLAPQPSGARAEAAADQSMSVMPRTYLDQLHDLANSQQTTIDSLEQELDNERDRAKFWRFSAYGLLGVLGAALVALAYRI